MMPTLSSLVAPEFVIMTFPYFYKSEMLKSSDILSYLEGSNIIAVMH